MSWGLKRSKGANRVPSVIPSDGLAGWFDASRPSTVTMIGSEVTQVSNRVPSGESLAWFNGNGPDYEASHVVANGKPAFAWPYTNNNKGLTLPAEVTVFDVFMVMAFDGGTTPVFTEYNTFCTDNNGLTGANATYRVTGQINQNYIRPNGLHGSFEINVNGVSVDFANTASVLPLPLSVVHIRNPLGFRVTAFGATNAGEDDRSFRGPVCEILNYDTRARTSDEVNKVTKYLAAKWGISL